MSILGYVLGALWFFLPAGVANAAPVILTKIPLIKHWTAPLDCRINYKRKRLLGDNKTWRGLVLGSLLAGITSLVQYGLFDLKVTGVNVASCYWLAFCVGLLMGFGALFGDALESFIKRQIDIKPGNGWFPFDQLDYIFGGLIISYPLTHASWKISLVVVITWFGVHLASVYGCYLAGLRDKPI